MALAEAFTVLAVLEATDRMSRVLEKVDGALDGFSETASKAAAAATEAGARIDSSLLETASGADALELADARVSAAQAKVAQTAKAQADAEKALLDAQAQAAAAGDEDAAAQAKLAAAFDAMSSSQKTAAKAAAEASAAQDRQAAVAKAAAAANDEAAGANDVAAAAQTKLGDASEESAGKSGLMSKAMGFGALAIAGIGYESIKAAGNWQNLTEHLVTDAGESQKNLAMVRSGMLQLAVQTGTSTTDIANGMYHVESAGYHGAQALSVMKAAAEGAKVGGADLDTVSKALTGTMNAYSMSGSQATSMMNQLVAAVGQGDMKMQDLASSLGNVAPVAAAAHISFAQVAGAIATMTAQNMSAQQATQDLSHTIGSLQNPNAVAVKEMQALGLNVNDVSKNIGKRGLTGTLDLLTQAVGRNTQGGNVLISTFQASQQAAANAQTEIKAMPGSLQSLAKAYLNGSVTSKQWTTDLQGLSPVQANLMKQFASTADQTKSFNQYLKSGSPAAQTYNAAMSKLLGGATGLKTALMLTGGRAATFNSNVAAIGKSAKSTGKDVDNWSAIQGTFNQKVDRLKSSVEAAGISIGTALLPVVTKIADAVLKVVTPVTNWITKHQQLTTIILGSIGGILGLAGGIKILGKGFSLVKGAVENVGKAFKTLKSLASGVADVAGKVKDAFGKVPWGKIGDGVTKGFSKAWDGISQGAQTAAQAVSDTFSKIPWSGLAQGAKDFAGKVGEITLKGGKAAWSGLVSGISAAKEAMTGLKDSEMLAAAWAKIQAGAQWVLDAAMDANPITLIVIALVALAAGFAYLWTHSAAFRDFWIGAWHDIEGAAKTVWGWLQDAFHGIMSLVDTVVGFVKSHWQLLLGIITGPIGMAVYLVTKYWGDIKKYFMDGVHAVLAAIDWLGQIPGKVWGFLVDMNTKISQALVTAVGWFAALPGKILNWLGQLGSDAVNIGVNFMQGLWNGLVSMGSWLYGQVMSLIKSVIPGPILHILGINSPSKWAHWAGQMVGHGLANGIVSTHDKVAQASKGLAQAITKGSLGAVTIAGAAVAGSLTANLTGAALPALAGAGGTGRPVEIHVHLEGARVMSDNDINKLASKVGNAIAKQLPAAGIKTRAY